MTTYGSCCYAECPNSYSTDSYAVFFKFPVEPARRKKWIENCGNPELTTLADRQLRGKRVCARHFPPSSFVNPGTKEALTEKAIPTLYRPSDPSQKNEPETIVPDADEEEAEPVASTTPASAAKSPAGAGQETVKRGRGRPPRKSMTQPSIKKEPEEVEPEPEEEDEEENEVDEDVSDNYVPKGTPKKAEKKEEKVKSTPAAPAEGKRRPGRPPGKKSLAAAVTPKASEDSASKGDESPGRSGKKSKTDEEDEEMDDKPITTVRTKLGLRKSLVARVEQEAEKEKRSLRVRTAKSEAEDEPATKKAKSPGPKSPTTSTPAKAQLKSKKNESGDESGTSDRDGGDGTVKDTKPTSKKDKSIEKFLAELKAHCVLSDQWTLSGILWDAGHKMKMIAASEMEVTSVGSMRLKRCVQIFEDMSVQILLDDINKTSSFEITKVSGPSDVTQLITKVALAKICPGIKTFETQDTNYFPMAVKRIGSWFSAECPVVVDSSLPGPLCGPCSRLRSSVRRRKIKDRLDLEKKQSKLLVKVQSKFGRALYSLLTELMTDDGGSKRQSSARPSLLLNQMGGRIGNDLVDSKEGILLSVDGRNGIPMNSKGQILTASSAARKIKPKGTPSGADETPKGKGRARSRVKNSIPGGQNSHSGEHGHHGVEMMEQFVTIEGEGGNLILQQNSGEFTLAEGQEYELIGEADAHEPMQVMDSDNPHQTIEIIEVDDQTMAQLTGQNVNEMFFQGTDNIQVTEIDPNDPSMGHLLKVIDPSQGGGFTFQ